MASSGKTAIGTILNRWDTVGTTGEWRTVAEVTNIDWGGASRNIIETFPLNNADRYVSKKQGTINAGQVTITVNYTKAEFIEMKRDLETSGTIDYQIKLPDGEALEFSGYVVELPLSMGSDDLMTIGDLVIEVDGSMTFASTATP
jgi:hypothetical protein